MTEDQIVPLGQFARKHNLELRFIEFMPLNSTGHWEDGDVLTGAEIRTVLEANLGALVPVARLDPSQPAINYRFADDPAFHGPDFKDRNTQEEGLGQIGFINSVSEPFCETCNRLRITAEGQLR